MANKPDNIPPQRLPEESTPRQITARDPQTDDSLDEYEEEEERGGCSGCGWGVAGMFGCMAIPLAVFVLIVVAGLNTVSGVLDGVTSIFRPPPPVYNTYSSAAILERIQAMSRLTTTRYNFSNIVTTERELPRLIELLYKDKLTLIAVGYIDAGVDLSAMTDLDIVLLDGVLTLRLPPPTLQNCALNEQESYVVSRDTGLFTDVAPEFDDIARQFAVRSFRDIALEKGILEEANDKAKAALELFIGGLPLDASVIKVDIQTTPPDPTLPYPEGCQ